MPLDSVIPAYVKYTGEQRPDAVFSTFLSGSSARQITFGALYAESCSYAQEYMRRGIGRGDIVLIILKHTPHLFSSFIGAMLVGAIPSFMPFPSAKQRPDLYWADHVALFERLRPRALVSYAENIEAAQTTCARFAIDMIVDDDSLFAFRGARDTEFPGLRAGPDDIACLQHSSGTTGLKKGVMLTHRAILAHVDAYSRAIAFSDADRIVSWLPLYHDMGFIACFMMSLINGTELVAIDPFAWSARPQLLFDAIAAYRPTLCWMPNFAFSHLVRTVKPASHVDLTSIRAFINCSEPCKAATFDRFAQRFADEGVDLDKLAVCYAMAENVFGVTQTRLGSRVPMLTVDADALSYGVARTAQVGRPAQQLLSCGVPIDGVRIRVCETNGDNVGAGCVGEIQIAGDSLFSGYYAEPERTRQRLRDGWYATGDLGFISADGELFVTGRVDDMIIVNGRNYYAHEIESLVASVPGISPGRVAAIGVADDESDVTGIVVLAELGAGSVSLATITRDVRVAVLERIGVAVARVVPLQNGSLIKTTSGKMNRIKNKQMYLEDHFAPCIVTT